MQEAKGRFPGWRGWRWHLAVLALLVLGAAVLRLGSLAAGYNHPDEVITVQVAQSMLERGSLDTNWALADLPNDFKYPQYNFSTYMLGAAAALPVKEVLANLASVDALTWLRGLSALLGVLVVALTYRVGRQLFGVAAGLGAAFLAAVNPLLYQDSLYARPETFVTVLTLAFLAVLRPAGTSSAARALAAAFIGGLLVATKVSMLLLLPLLLVPLAGRGLVPPLPAAWRSGRQSADAIVMAALLGLAVMAGFCAGVPYALVHMDAFLEGILFLNNQYTGGHWPHGPYDDGPFGQLFHAARYFGVTTGVVLVCSLAGGVAAALRREYRQALVFAVAAATALRFTTYPVFFERNLSHVMPVLLVFAAHGLDTATRALIKRPGVRHAVLAFAVVAVAVPSIRTTKAIRVKELSGEPRKHLEATRRDVEARTGYKAVWAGWAGKYNLIQKYFAHQCGPMLVEFGVVDSDPQTNETLRRLVASDSFTEVGRVYSVFARYPTSTLNTYFTPSTVFLLKAPDIKRCRHMRGTLVSREMAGDLLPLRTVEADRAWTRGGGGFGQDAFGSTDYRGSWSGSDANTGRLRLVVDTSGTEFLVLPYATGPTVKGLSITIADADSGKTLFSGLLTQPTPRWEFFSLRLPEGTRSVSVEATDRGREWGEWMALGMPRALKTGAPPRPPAR